MAHQDQEQSPVVIVGGGPVGMGLAIDLGRRGIRCTVVERHDRPQPIPKGQNLTQRTMEHFHVWGAENQIRAARTIPKDYGIGGLTTYGTLLSEYSYDWLQRELVRPYYFTDNERLPQYATEEVLRRRVRDFPTIDVLYGWTAETVSQSAEGVSVTIVGGDGTERRTLRASFLVGCDGSRSIVRDEAGIGLDRSEHDKRMVLLVFRSEELHRLLQRYPGKSFYNVLDPELEGYWKFFGRVDLGTTWFFHAPVPADTTRENFDFRRYLHTAVGAAFDVELEHVGFWDLRIATARTYRNGRIFIAGDAAHSHPPYGAYGINTGFEDVRNIGWKLAATLDGWSGDNLLASYTEERRPVFVSTARDFIEKAIRSDRDFLAAFSPERDREAFEREWKARGSGAHSEVHAFEPHYEGSPIVWGPPGGRSDAKGRHVFEARPGHHLAPQPLSGGRNAFEALGEGFTLLALDADEAIVASFEQAARVLGIPLQIVRDGPGEARDRYGAELILVRPDEFVAWRSGAGPEDPEAVLRKAIGA